MFIALPERIPMLRPRQHQTIRTDKEEYNLYFCNIIHPYSQAYDVQTECEYGRNYGSYWRLDSFPYDIDSFPLTIRVYDTEGELLAERTVSVELFEKDHSQEPLKVLPIGDSMTQAQKYLEHITSKLRGVQFMGSRSFDGVIAHEGRGGFASEDYRYKHQDPYAYSPFVFPVGVKAADYYGDLTFWTAVNEHAENNFYVYDGYKKRELHNGQIYNKEDILYRIEAGKESVWSSEPHWEFHFGKYLEQQSFGTPDVISILLGTNDIMKLHYADMESGISKTLENMRVMIKSIRQALPQVKLVLNLPILPTVGDYAFGHCFGCKKSSKESRMIMLEYLRRFIAEWDGKEDEGIYLSAMHAVIDPINGFRTDTFSKGLYYEELSVEVGEAIHPNRAGYFQMGDALAAVLQKIRMTQAKG